MNHKVRLGPIAIFLVVIAIVLTVLATLSLATTTADRVMAERFAYVTSVRYELEAEGQKFLRDYSEQAASGNAAETHKTITKDGYTLDIEVTAPGGDGSYEIVKWQITKDWNAEDPYDHIWKGADK
jgi:hypothetical protein